MTAPAEEPVSIEEAKQHCRIDGATDDWLVAAYIAAARQWAESYTLRSFVTQTWRLKRAAFPADVDYIELPRPPLISVSSIAYLNEEGASTPWANTNYVVNAEAIPGRLSRAWDVVWPTSLAIADAVTITYIAGYGTSGLVPEAIKAAIMLQAADLYAVRERSIIGVSYVENPTACSLLAPYRMIEVA